jgi:signal transduction histidine kinase
MKAPTEQERELERARIYLLFKWGALAAIFCVVTIEALFGKLAPTSAIATYIGFTLTGGSGLVLEWLSRQKRSYPSMTLFSLLLDQGLIFMAIYLVGGPESHWWFLPVCLIFLAGYIFNQAMALLLALFSTVFMLLDFLLEYLNLLPHHHAAALSTEYFRNSYYLFDYFMGMTLLYLLGALISGYFTRLMSQTTVELEESLKASEAARAEEATAHQALLRAMDDLDRTKQELENKVRERTAELEETKRDLTAKVKERTADLEESRRAILHMMKDLKDDIAKLQVVDKMKTEFLSMVSHELRTPLTPIKGYLALLLSGKMGEVTEQQRRALTVLDRQSEHLHALIDSVLDLSRIELGKAIPLSKESLSMRTVIEETVDAMKIQANERDVQLAAEIADNLPATSGDVIKLKRVLANLVGNAIKFTAEKGVVTIKAFPADSLIRVEVIDNGIGLLRENLERVFEKFYQVDSSITRAAGGMGMGLSIAKELIELHGGKIWLESDGLGKGTRAIFLLPVV